LAAARPIAIRLACGFLLKKPKNGIQPFNLGYLSNTDSLGISSSENSNKPKRPMITIGYRHAAAPAGGGASLTSLADAGDEAPTDTRRRIRIASRHPSARDFVFSQLGRGA
jgi:hypothetical protein